MRTLLAILALAYLGFAPAGCASLGLEKPQTFHQRIAYAYANITGAREGALQALQAGTITPDDAEQVQGLANRARASVDAARTLYRPDAPASALDALRLAEGILAELTAYLNRKGIK